MTLTECKKNDILNFVSFNSLMPDQKQKLTDMGMIPGEELKMLRDSSSGLITVSLKNSKIAMDRKTASGIIVKKRSEN